MKTACIFNIQRFSVHDGPGIRQTVFFKGCPLRCAWCHNPESQHPKPEVRHELKQFRNKEILIERQIGEQYTAEQLFQEIQKDILLYEESGGGVTFSGGEPLLHIDFLCEVMSMCKKHGIAIALDTCGHIPQEDLAAVFPYVDLYLYDIKSLDTQQHLKACGQENNLILENLLWLDFQKANVEIRFPLIPSFNDRREDLLLWVQLREQLKHIDRIHILPFHRLGKEKYLKMSKSYPMEEQPIPTDDHVQSISYQLTSMGFDVSSKPSNHE